MNLHISNTLILFFGIFFSSMNAQITYVKEGGTGNGTSWANATGNLKNALGNASFGMQVWVAEGIYTPTTCTSCTYSDRNLSFFVPDGVKLYGGFEGNENSLDDRNFENHPTILSGDIDGDGTKANNSYSIIFTQWVTDHTEIDGFIVTGGNADFAAALGNSANSGAGLFNNGALDGLSSHPIIRNCTFMDNQAWGYGGAVMNDGAFKGDANPAFVNCRFENNYAQNAGGAVYNSGIFEGHASPKFESCEFENNHSTNAQGGAVYNSGATNGESSPQFLSCSFTENTAGESGGAVYNFANHDGICEGYFRDCLFNNNTSLIGGALYNDGSFNGECSPILDNCVFEKNQATNGDAGAVYNSGIESGHTNPVFNYCTFRENESDGAGGAIFSNGVLGSTEPVLSNCIVHSNIANTFGGGIYNMGKNGNASPKMTNCLIYDNVAISSAGGMYNLGAENGNSSPIVTNCTFFGNKAVIGGAIYNNASAPNGNASPIIKNTIIWGNEAELGQVFRNILGTPEISYSVVDAPDCEATNSSNGMGQTICGEGMFFNVYPEFQDTANFNLHLKEISPVVDMGDNAAINSVGMGFDLDSLPRIYGDIVDLGPYEFGSFINNVPVLTTQPLSQEVCEESEVILFVNATAPVNLSYQWQMNGEDILSETTDTLIISDANLGDSGEYSCLVFNEEGDTIFSDLAILVIIEKQNVEIEIIASEIEICEGTPVVLEANPLNEGSSPNYQWYLNGNAFGGNVQSFTSTDLNDGDELFCILTSSADCINESMATSNTIQIKVNENVEASIEIEANETEICEGEEVELVANIENGGSDPTFQWRLNGQNTGQNQNIFITSMLNDNDIITCSLTSNAECVINPIIQSDSLQITVSEFVESSIVIQASETQICENDTVFFQASSENGGNNPIFQWQLNGQNIGQNEDVFTSNDLKNGDVVSCVLTSNAECISNSNALSNIIEMDVSENGDASIEIVTDATEICQNEQVVLIANIQNGGDNPTFQWFLNNQPFGSNLQQIVTTELNDGDIISCDLISDAECISNPNASSNTLTISVIDIVNAEVNIQSASVEICEGQEATFTAMPIHGGLNPTFQWFVNSVLVQANGHIFNTSNLDDGDIITCQMTSDLDCVLQSTVLSQEVQISISPLVEASIDVSANQDEICEGDEVVFTADFQNGGTNPQFEWFVNSNFTGNTTSTFSTSFLNDGDIVTCNLSSSENCVLNNPVYSNDIVIGVNPISELTLEIFPSTDTTICLGDTVTFFADYENAGDNPLFEWTINGETVGGSFPEFMTNDLNNLDEVTCSLTSDEMCLVANEITSNLIKVSVDDCSVGNVNTSWAFVDFQVYPNPSYDGFWIKLENVPSESTLEVIDINGRIHRKDSTPTLRSSYSKLIETDTLVSGVYFVRLINEKGILIRKVIIK